MPKIKDQLVIDVTGMSPADLDHLKQAITTALIRPDSDDHTAALGWTTSAAILAIQRLRTVGRPVQEAVLRAESRDGFVSRDVVYQLGGYDPERQLKGFTRALNAIVRDLKEEHALPSDAADPMAPVWLRGGINSKSALGFEMPEELKPIFAEAFAFLGASDEDDEDDD